MTIIHATVTGALLIALACQPQVQVQQTAAPTPSPSAAPAQANLPTRVDTIAPPTVRESPFSFTSGTLSLPGTLTLPTKARRGIPVALIIAGSGPTDRNGNSSGALRQMNNSNLYAQLAWRLAERGIATLRYDKRGLGESLSKIDVAATSIDDFIGDVRAGADALTRDARFGRVYLVGHSEGAELALQAANRGTKVAGVAMLAGAGRNILVIMREQLAKQLSGVEMTKWDTAVVRFQRGEDPGDVNPALKGFFQPQMRKFMTTWIAYEPAEEMARVGVPVLIVHGALDVQVSEADAQALMAAQPAAKLVIIPKANHVFRTASSTDMMAQLALYRDPTIPIVPELASTVGDWILMRK
ncbi:MAG TPA: alpha/beta fold hydrolase [Gemmatimonadaceae bacterium]|nr:alpha/beta fold hydrolase [Gemmatimonadaceae bacterium]